MTKGRPLDNITKLLDQFENSKTSLKSKRKKNEKLINIFYRRFYNICRSLADGTNTNPQFLEIKKIMSSELQLVVQSKLWPKKFIHKSEQALYSGLKKSQFSIKSCKLIRKQFNSFSSAVYVYSNILVSSSEKEIESFFKYQCSGKFDANLRKKLWGGLIKDHLSQIGIEKSQRKSQDLMALIDEISTAPDIQESEKTTLEEIPSNESLFNTYTLQNDRWLQQNQEEDIEMESFDEATLPSTEDEEITLTSIEDEDEKFIKSSEESHYKIHSSDRIRECDFINDINVDEFLSF